MTTENSVRVPHKDVAIFVRDVYRRMQSSYESGDRITMMDLDEVLAFATEQRISLDAAQGILAAPAPAGARRSTHRVWSDLASVTESWPCYCGAETDHVIGNEATLQPEQGAGLVLAEMRDWLKEGWELTKRSRLESWVERLEAALARQQSRVVDEAMIERARQCIVMLRQHLGLFAQDDIALAMFETAEDIETELRAALEGARDGR